MDHVNLFSRLPKTQKGAVGNQIWWICTAIMTTLCVLLLNYRQNEGAGGDCSSGRICLNLSLSFNSFFPVWVSGTRRHSRTSDLLWRVQLSDHHQLVNTHQTAWRKIVLGIFTKNSSLNPFPPATSPEHPICYGKFSAKLAHSPSPCHRHTRNMILIEGYG